MKYKMNLLICMMLFIGCAATVPKGNPERFDISFIESCPQGYKFQWKNGYCVDGDCDVECVREDKTNPCYQVEDAIWGLDDRYACCPEEFPCKD